jgi:hypothetical protein
MAIHLQTINHTDNHHHTSLIEGVLQTNRESYVHTHTIGHCLLINSKKGTTIFIILRFFSLALSVYRSPAPFEKKKEAPLAAAGSGEESRKNERLRA